jgi:hypothetical protein
MGEKKERKQDSDHRNEFFIVVKGCIKEDRIRNESIRDDVQIYSIKDKLDETRIKCREHIARMEEDRLPEAVISCKQMIRRLQDGLIHVCKRRRSI